MHFYHRTCTVNNMAPTLYMMHLSPAVRAVLITAKALELDLIEKEILLTKGEHLKPEYLKLNPQHTIPTLDDNGFILSDSHAINAYLVTKYGKNSTLLPTDPEKRGIVDQRLHFDSSILFNRLLRVGRPIIRGDINTINSEDRDALIEAYGFLEAFLNGQEWAAGDSVTIADYSLISTITSINVIVPIDAKVYPNIVKWMRKVESLPEYEANRKGLQIFSDLILSKLN